jgi:hypothetical protein
MVDVEIATYTIMEENLEMQVIGEAADMRLTMQWSDGMVKMICEDTATDLPKEHREVTRYEKLVTPTQAGAVIALFVAGDFDSEELNQLLYDTAEEALIGAPRNCRPIP